MFAAIPIGSQKDTALRPFAVLISANLAPMLVRVKCGERAGLVTAPNPPRSPPKINSHDTLDGVFTLCEYISMSQPDFIEQLGGTGAVATELRQNDSTVSMWRVRGIPWRWRPTIAELAKRRGVDVPSGFLEPAGKGEVIAKC